AAPARPAPPARSAGRGGRRFQRRMTRALWLGLPLALLELALKPFERFQLFLAEAEMVGELVDDRGADVAQKRPARAAGLLHRPPEDLDHVRMAQAVRLLGQPH